MHGRILGCLFFLVLATGCASRVPTSALANETTPDRIALEGFVSYFTIHVERTAGEIAQLVDDPDVQRSAVYWKMRVIPIVQNALLIADNQAAGIRLWVISAAMASTAAGPIGASFGDGQSIAVTASNAIEKRASNLMTGMLTPEQFQVADAKVKEFVNAHVDSTGMKYSPEEARSWGEAMTSILHKPIDILEAPLSSLNPTSGLSDTAQVMQHFTDEFHLARKEMGYMPSLLRWNTELLLMELEQSNKFSTAVDSLAQVGASATSLAATAKDLPEELRKQLTTLAEDLGKPQTELRTTLEVANTTLTNTQHTAESVDAMGATLTGTLDAFITMMGTFDTSDDEPDAAPPTPPEQQAAPYDINDYGRTAEKVTVTANALTALLTEAGALTNAEQPPALLADTEATTHAILEDAEATTRSVLAETEVIARSLVDRIYFGAAALVLFTALVAFVYRVAVARRALS